MSASSAARAVSTRPDPSGGRRDGPARPALPDWRRIPAWGQALLLFAASRVLVTFVAHRNAYLAAPHPDGRHWSYLEIANNWDGTWYRRIVDEGYPAVLPVDSATGLVAPNTWAFYPLFPRLVQSVMHVTGLDWTVSATLVSLVCSASAVVLIRSVIAHVAGPRLAMWSVAFVCFFPSALVLQLPYSEGVALLGLAAVFRCLQHRRYLLLVPVLLLLGLARPVGVPMAVVLTVHLLRELLAVRQLPSTLAWRSLAGPGVAWVAGGVAAAEWPILAWRGTGVRDAYTLTMASWRTPPELVPVRPWIGAAQYFFGTVTGPVLLAGGIGAFVWWLARHGPRTVGADLTTWCASYCAYLLAVLDSFTSLPRYLLPLFPLGTMLASASSSRAFRVAVTVAFAVGGMIWMLAIWRSGRWAP